MEINRTESAKFAIAADQLASKLTDGVEKALAENAAEGFMHLWETPWKPF